MKKRLSFLTIFFFVLACFGTKWRQSVKNTEHLQLQISFKALRRLLFDEAGLRHNEIHTLEAVRMTFELHGRDIQGMVSPLTTQGTKPLNAFLLNFGEDAEVEARSLIVMRDEFVKEKLMGDQLFPIARGQLAVNGKLFGHYSVIIHPFHAALMQGLGPLAHWNHETFELSPLSQGYEIFRELGTKNAAFLPKADSQNWFAWDENSHSWKPWGHWPKEWTL